MIIYIYVYNRVSIGYKKIKYQIIIKYYFRPVFYIWSKSSYLLCLPIINQ